MRARQYGSQQKETIMNGTPRTPSSADDAAPKTRRRWFAAMAAMGGLGLLSAGSHAKAWGRGGPLDAEEMSRRMEWRIGRMVQQVGGTTEQKDRLVAIARAAMADIQPLREQARLARRQGVDLLAATVIDRAALERVRVAQMQAADARSRRMVQAMADAADVLTPEQRVKMAERMRQRLERRRG
jgi:Spy/CpxP family protein refolding chaperone